MAMYIRAIAPDDVQQVFALQIALAEAENLMPKFKLTLPILQDALFGPVPDLFGLVAIANSSLVGFCTYSFVKMNRSLHVSPTLYLDDLFVLPHYRQQGLGRAFFHELTRIAHSHHAERIEWWCLKDNAIGQAFYQKLQAKKLESMDVYRLDITDTLTEMEKI
jgi:GNAT superfamily N-acetyltransferase